MRPVVIILACFCGCLNPLFGKQPEKRHLFVEWRHWDSTIVLGTLEGKKFRQKTVVRCLIRKLESGDVQKWLGKPGNGKVLMYFHAMWGQQPNFQRKCLRSIEQILRTQTDTGMHTVISFIWHAGGMAYPLNWRQSCKKGESLGEIMGWICMHYKYKVNVLCHSMGNRVFEGALRKIPHQSGDNTLFDNIILFSPDLDADVGTSGFSLFCRASGTVTVFIHRRDRLLMLSRWILGRERLGRSGPKGDTAAFSNMLIIDMTDQVRGLQNHTHLGKAWVQERMLEVLDD